MLTIHGTTQAVCIELNLNARAPGLDPGAQTGFVTDSSALVLCYSCQIKTADATESSNRYLCPALNGYLLFWAGDSCSSM